MGENRSNWFLFIIAVALTLIFVYFFDDDIGHFFKFIMGLCAVFLYVLFGYTLGKKDYYGQPIPFDQLTSVFFTLVQVNGKYMSVREITGNTQSKRIYIIEFDELLDGKGLSPGDKMHKTVRKKYVNFFKRKKMHVLLRTSPIPLRDCEQIYAGKGMSYYKGETIYIK